LRRQEEDIHTNVSISICFGFLMIRTCVLAQKTISKQHNVSAVLMTDVCKFHLSEEPSFCNSVV